MAHFIGYVRGAKGKASRLGNKASGMEVTAASWQGAVHVHLYAKDGVDHCRISLTTWQGEGTNLAIYEGPVSGADDGMGKLLPNGAA